MSCRVHEDGKTGNANEVCFGDERTSKIYNQAALLELGCPKAAEQAMHTKCLSAMRCPKAAEQGMQTPFYDHFDHRDHLVRPL
jgi:hypothetical protein